MSSNRYGHNYFCGTKLDKPVTIASLQAHGVSQLVVYCRGKRNWDWPCHHSGELPLDRFRADEVLGDIERRCRCTGLMFDPTIVGRWGYLRVSTG